jgi:hypothetical protein
MITEIEFLQNRIIDLNHLCEVELYEKRLDSKIHDTIIQCYTEERLELEKRLIDLKEGKKKEIVCPS